MVNSNAKKMIKVKINGGETLEFKKGVKIFEVAEYLGKGLFLVSAAGLVDNVLVDLAYELTSDCDLNIVTLDTMVGMKVYRRSVEYALAIAVKELFGENSKLLVGPHIEKGYYFDLIIKNRDYVSEKEVNDIRNKMQDIINRGLEFELKKVSKKEAKKILTDRKDLLSLIDDLEDSEVKLYFQKESGFADLYHGPIFPNTKFINAFDLLVFAPGFILQFPDYVNKVLIMPKQPKQIKLTQVLRETREWYKIQGIENVSRLNEVIKSGEISELIKIAEAFQEKKVAQIADLISARRDQIKFITIAGPSSSGKTTFAKRLSIQLKVNGIFPIALSLDDYFVEREKTPRDENGISRCRGGLLR
ncbi:MAG TPA: hypothetical protein PLQ81_04830 [bacterium]|nr:hypothetical protein [bacterium]